MNVKNMNFSSGWKKMVAASFLPLSMLMAMPVGMLPQDGQVYVSMAAAQELDKEQKAGSMLEEQMEAFEQAKELLRAQYGVNKQITDGNYDRSLAVKCVNGTFVGNKTENVIAYRGIPFVGKPPVGELRWKAPVDVVPDSGVYEAYYNAKSAYGNEQLETGSLFYQDEDCLYLNIWKADENPAKKKPVMVWIHGGAFEAGGTVDPMFDCHNFVQENTDVIVVTIAYRLGPFGFLHLSHLPDGKDYQDAQNLGLLDQMKALKWVQEHGAEGGFINGFLKHYPDFLAMTKSGVLLDIETKGNDRDNSDSRRKLEMVKAWEGAAGGQYGYFMVFDKKPMEGAYALEDFMDMVRDV